MCNCLNYLEMLQIVCVQNTSDYSTVELNNQATVFGQEED